MYLIFSTLDVVSNIGEQFEWALLYNFFCKRRDLLLIHTATLIATMEITMTHTLIFDYAQITLSAT